MTATGMWLARGLVLGTVWVVARVVVGAIVEVDPGFGTIARSLGLVTVVAVAVVWGVFDGRTDRRLHPDPDHGGADLTAMWLAAAVTAGLLCGGFASWVVGSTGVEMGDNTLLIELVAAAPWLMLLVFVGGITGCAIGARLVERRQPAFARHGLHAEEG